MSNPLEEYRKRLEGMVADSAAEIAELKERCLLQHECSALTCMNFELNGMCLALRALDEEAYETVSFTDPVWVRQHQSSPLT